MAGGGSASISSRHTCGLSKVVVFSAQGGKDGDGRRYPRAGLWRVSTLLKEWITYCVQPSKLPCDVHNNSLFLFSCSVMSDTLRPYGLQHTRFPCPSPSPRVDQTHVHWVGDAIQPSVIPFSSCLWSFPASESFPVSQLFASGGQSIRASAFASVLPMNIQGGFPLGLTGFISLLSRDSQESSLAPQFKSINSSAPSLPYGPTLTSIHDYWKNQSFDYTDLCWPSNVSAF